MGQQVLNEVGCGVSDNFLYLIEIVLTQVGILDQWIQSLSWSEKIVVILVMYLLVSLTGNTNERTKK